jgi:Flp pilus assembly protein TadG
MSRKLVSRFKTGWNSKTHEGGSALVEAALTLPLLVFMLLGVVELGRVTYIAIETSNAAKAAVQYGAQNSMTAIDQAGMEKVAQMEASGLASKDVNVSISSSGDCSCSSPDTDSVKPFDCHNAPPDSCPSPSHIEQTVTATVTASFNPFITLPGLPAPFTLTGKAVQKRLQ